MAQIETGKEPLSVNSYQFDTRGNIHPVKLVIDTKNYQLKIEKDNIAESEVTSPTSPVSPTSPLRKKRRRSSSFQKFFSRLSYDKRMSSTVPTELTLSTHSPKYFVPEAIPLNEVKEFRTTSFDSRKASAQTLKELGIGSICQRRTSQNKYKTGVLLFGTQFNLKKYIFLIVEPVLGQGHDETCNGKGTWKIWLDELMGAIEEYASLGYLERLNLWYRKQFEIVEERATITHRLKIWKQFMNRCHHRVITQNLEKAYEELEPLLRQKNSSWCSGPIGRDEFEVVARYFVHCDQSISQIFLFTGLLAKYLHYVQDKSELLPEIGSDLDTASDSYKAAIKLLAERLKEKNPDLVVEEKFLHSFHILDYLFSEDNSIWDPDHIKEYQDMDRPLSHYWINSSHNSYLTGNQYSSQSSVEPYARILRMGCRCIEIDVWNGPFNKPIVKHGMTLTSSVPLKDVVKTIKENAFVKTPYPLIISIENHCNLRQQKVMAKYFRKIFGRALVTSPIGGPETIKELPSPNQLKNRIIIKGRSLPPSLFEDKKPNGPARNIYSNESGEVVADGEGNPCDCLITGELWICSDRIWIPCIFVLTNQKLFFIERQDQPGRAVQKARSKYRNSVSSVDSNNQDLHMDQSWYYGKIPGGRLAANELLQEFGRNGAFMVRESEAQPGEYTLSIFMHKPCHCRIHSRMTNKNERKFYLKIAPKEEEIFPSLYELIEFYKRNPVTTNDFHLDHLGPPVPPSATHENEEWFYKDMDRRGAEAVLEKLRINGAFMGRYHSEDGRIVISFRFENVIKHCIIDYVGRYLVVSNKEFRKLEKLVEHYKEKAFYKDIKLSHPVDNALYMRSQLSDCSEGVYKCKEYINSLVKTVKGSVRAVQSYSTDDPDLLAFRKGDKIVNVVKEPDGWWWGIREDQLGEDVEPKQFCSSFVEECEEMDIPFGDVIHNGCFKLGCGVKWKLCKDKNVRQYGLKFYLRFKDPDGKKWKLGAKCSKRKINEWVDMINYIVDKDEEGKIRLAKIQAATKYNIASEFSDLIIYCNAMDRLNPEEVGDDKNCINVTLLKSLDEVSGDRLFRSKASYFVWYHQFALTRVYPKSNRLDSSNFEPVRFWNFGSQMVALNWQTNDKAMQLNRGKFKENGNCGYLLKPNLLLPNLQEKTQFMFDPTRLTDDGHSWDEIILHLDIISARHLEKQDSGPIFPIVEIDVVGVDADRMKVKTPSAMPNSGMSPSWNHSFALRIRCPELALVQFKVCHVDTFSDNVLIGESTIPIPCIRQGYRSIQLNNSFGEPLFSTLLVKVSTEKIQNEPSSSISH